MVRTSQTKSRRYKWLFVSLAPFLVFAGGAGWLVASESGLQWLIGVVQLKSRGDLSVKGISGSLIDNIFMQQLVLRGDGWRVTLQGVQLEWQPAALLRGELEVLHLSARQVEILSLTSDTPSVLPGNLGLPLLVSVKQLKIDSISVATSVGAEPDFLASKVEASLTGDARILKLQSLSANLGYGDFSGSGELGLNQPYVVTALATLDAEMTFSGKPEHAHFDASAGGNLEHIVVKLDGGGAGISINGMTQLAPFSTVPVSHLQLAFKGMDARLLLDGAPPAILAGKVDLHGMPAGGLEGSLQILNAHAAPLDRNGLPLSGVTSRVRWSSSQLQLQQLDARLPNDGHITGTVSWEAQHGKLRAELKAHGIDTAAMDTRLPSTHLHGDISFDGLGEDQQAIVVLSDGKLDLYGEFKRQGSQLELTSVRLTRGDTVLTGHGQLAMDRRRSFRLSSQLHKLDLSEFAALPKTDLNMEADVSGTLLPDAKGKLQLNLSNSHFAQHDISGSGNLEFTGARRATAAAVMRLGDNHFDLDIAYGTDADRVKLILDAPSLAQLGGGYKGNLAGHAYLYGSLVEPKLQFSVKGRDVSLPGGRQFAALDATGDLASAALQLNLALKDYRSEDGLNIPEAGIELQGSRGKHSLQAFARIEQGDEALGDLTLKVVGGLSDTAPGWQSLQWHGEVDELTSRGAVPFHLLTAVPLSFAKDSFHLGTADLATAGGNIQFTGSSWTPQRWHSAGHFSGINVRAVNMQQSKSDSDAFDSIRIGGSWDATADEHWKGGLQVHRESGDWVMDANTGLRLGLHDMQLSLRAEQDQLHAQLDASGDHLGELKLQANMPLSHTDTGWTILPDAPLTGYLRLFSDDLAWLGPVLDSNLQSGGRLKFDAELLGTLRAPRLHGEAQGDALSFAMLDQGIRVEQGELKARFETDTVYIDRFAFSAPYLPPPRDKFFADYTFPSGIGKLSATGRIDLEGVQGDLAITADRLPLLQRTDRWVIASGTGHARYTDKTLMLDGNIRVDAGLINQPVSDRPRFSDDVQITGKETARRAALQRSVDATLDLGDHFYIRASGLEGRLAGQLKVLSEPGMPLRVTGIIAAQNAVFNAYGQRLLVERGIVNFQGPLDDPGLNILALRKGVNDEVGKGLEVEAGVEVTGTVRRPEVRLVSTPNVPDNEKLSWIVLGRVPESGGVDSALLFAAAGSILGGQSAGQIGRTLGVDEISLSQETGADSQQINKVKVGKQLSARTRISYEQDLNETGGITKFTYSLTPRITIVTSAGTDDALDIFYTFRFY
jgi:translocation and assembly module TamB